MSERTKKAIADAEREAHEHLAVLGAMALGRRVRRSVEVRRRVRRLGVLRARIERLEARS